MLSLVKQFIVVLLVLLLACCPQPSFGQSRKADLQKQRDELNEKIALTKKLIKDSETQQKLTTNQVAVLMEQIRYREKLLQNINQEIGSIESEIGRKEKSIHSLESQLSAMKDEYAKMIVNAYKSRSAYDKLMFIFSAENFNQAYKRFKLTQRYAEVRKDQVTAMQKTQREISETISLLQKDKEEKVRLASSKENEKVSISRDKQSEEKKLGALRAEEKKLRDQQKKQESDRKKLTLKIEEIIRAEIEAERKRNEESLKKTSGTTGNSSGKTFELAPEVKLINSDFEKNKGSLPWPVGSGIITSRFGRQAHPSIAGIEIENKGIDLTTEKNGSVLAVFAGKVTSVFSIPGAGQNVIITHGSYKTVYSGMSEVLVGVGESVSTRQKIGNVLFNGEENILHFEVWKVSTEAGAAQNPELWIRGR